MALSVTSRAIYHIVSVCRAKLVAGLSLVWCCAEEQPADERQHPPDVARARRGEGRVVPLHLHLPRQDNLPHR